MNKRQRDELIDIVKGIGIFLVVFGHADIPFLEIRQLFHLPLFFIASGYLYQFHQGGLLKDFIGRKIKGLYMPCAVSVIALVLLNNVFLDLHIFSSSEMDYLSASGIAKGIMKGLLFSGGGQLLGANWFFRTLFIAIVLYEIINRICYFFLKDERRVIYVRAFICFGALIVDWGVDCFCPNVRLLNFLCVLSLIDIGYILKRFKILLKVQETKSINKVVLFLFTLAGLVVMRHFDSISITSNRIVNPLFFLVCSLFGFLMSYVFAMFINTWRNPLSTLLIYAGRKSIVIMLLHFIMFKIITLVQIILFQLPIETLSAYPTNITSNGWWLAYGTVGILVPLCIAYGMDIIKMKVKIRR